MRFKDFFPHPFLQVSVKLPRFARRSISLPDLPTLPKMVAFKPWGMFTNCLKRLARCFSYGRGSKKRPQFVGLVWYGLVWKSGNRMEKTVIYTSLDFQAGLYVLRQIRMGTHLIALTWVHFQKIGWFECKRQSLEFLPIPTWHRDTPWYSHAPEIKDHALTKIFIVFKKKEFQWSLWNLRIPLMGVPGSTGLNGISWADLGWPWPGRDHWGTKGHQCCTDRVAPTRGRMLPTNCHGLELRSRNDRRHGGQNVFLNDWFVSSEGHPPIWV